MFGRQSAFFFGKSVIGMLGDAAVASHGNSKVDQFLDLHGRLSVDGAGLDQHREPVSRVWHYPQPDETGLRYSFWPFADGRSSYLPFLHLSLLKMSEEPVVFINGR